MSELETPVAEAPAVEATAVSNFDHGYAKCIPGTLETAESLTKKLTWLTKVISSNPVVPVMENVLFQDGVMYASDLQVTNMHYTDIKGCFLLPAKKLLSILKNLDKTDEVSFSSTGENYMVEVRVNGEVIFRLAGENTQDYPKLPVETTNVLFAELLHKDDIDNLTLATKYVSKDELRPAMTGVLITEEDLISTDGHLMFMKKFSSITRVKEGGFSFIIPKKAISMIKDFGYAELKHSQPVEVTEESPTGQKTREGVIHNVLIKQGARAVLTRVIDEKFPNYKAVVPKSNHIKATFSKKDILQTVTLALEAANKITHQVRLKLVNGNEQATMSSEDLDFSFEFKKKISVKLKWGDLEKVTERALRDENGLLREDENGEAMYEKTTEIIKPEEGEVFEIGFNGKFLQAIIKDTDSQNITIAMAAANKAALINDDILVMPVMLNQYA